MVGTEEARNTQPIKVFYSYAHRDERLRQRLEAHLGLLRQQGLIVGWYDRDISAGTEWKHAIDKHLDEAQIILLLISADFLNSEYCYSVEMKHALSRHQTREARVIPILLREVEWGLAPFSHLQLLPSTGKPVTSRFWRTRDEAFTDVTRGIHRVIEELRGKQNLIPARSDVSPAKASKEANPEQAASRQPENDQVGIPKRKSSFRSDILITQREDEALNMPYISDLKESLQRRSLTLFIGNDLPRSITGLSSRADLARGLARLYGLNESFSLAEVAQRVSQAGNRFTFTAFIRDALDITDKSPQPFHRYIVELVQMYQIDTLISTAYDRLLEMAFQGVGKRYNHVISANDVAFIRVDHPTFIKLYGDIQQPNTLVVTERDHSDLLHNPDKEPLLEEVRRAFRRSTVLFLGYNLSDVDFRLLFDQIAQGTFAQRAYAVWSGFTNVDVLMWRERGILIIDAHPLDILELISQ